MIPEAKAAIEETIGELQESRIETIDDQKQVISILKDAIKRVSNLRGLPEVA